MSMKVSLFRLGRFSHWVDGGYEYVITPTLRMWDGEYEQGEYDDNWWHNGKMVVKRPPCPVRSDGLFLRGVLAGSTIYIEGKAYECAEGGDIELSFQFPGTYEVTISNWPYLTGSYTIENPPPTQ